jgi:hypothetical protein
MLFGYNIWQDHLGHSPAIFSPNLNYIYYIHEFSDLEEFMSSLYNLESQSNEFSYTYDDIGIIRNPSWNSSSDRVVALAEKQDSSRQLVQIDLDGNVQVLYDLSGFGVIRNLSISPSGRYIALLINTDSSPPYEDWRYELGIYDLESGEIRLTCITTIDEDISSDDGPIKPIWSPIHDQVAMTTAAKDENGLLTYTIIVYDVSSNVAVEVDKATELPDLDFQPNFYYKLRHYGWLLPADWEINPGE